ncbi:hypothetical protein KJ611_03475 [Patescibacteria group bacterium]|nr:hypothetical protein [Patescibacteria group bacterium]MBU1705780.1 hypothetical protein [Patescibacteria group bacterium]
MKLRLLYIGIALLILFPFSAQAFSVAPGIVEISSDRGQTIETSISLINIADTAITVYLSKQKFEPNESSGAPKFIPYDDNHSGLVDWLQFPADRITVEARTKVDVPVSIVVPNDIPSGGYYGAAVFSEAPHEIVATNGASINAKTAVLLLLTVNGETDAKIALLDFTSPQAGSLVSLPSGEFTYRLQNQGNVHVQPQGTIILKDILGRIVSVANPNPAEGRVLPNSTRTYTGQFGPEENGGFVQTVKTQWQNFALGPVKAVLDLSYGSNQQVLTSELSFWVLPWQLLITILVIVLILGLALKGLKRNIQKA